MTLEELRYAADHPLSMNILRKLFKRLRRKHRETPRRVRQRVLNVYRSAGPHQGFDKDGWPIGYDKIVAKLVFLRKHGGSHPVTRARGDALRALVGHDS